jgi:hypothetical protein
VYEGGASYVAAKHALTALRETLRLEVVERGVRVSEVAPGMVQTEEFSVQRFGGDEERAAAVYAGVDALTAEDVAEAVVWVAGRPAHVNIDLVQMTPQQQAGVGKVVRRRPEGPLVIHEAPVADPASRTATRVSWITEVGCGPGGRGRLPCVPKAKRYAAGRARVLGLPTRGTTAPNRLRRVDRWLTAVHGGLLRSAAARPWWSTSGTAPRP